jgi:hypothetical protein
MARLSGNIDPEMNSPIQLHRFASMCHAIASAEHVCSSEAKLQMLSYASLCAAGVRPP